MGENLRLGQRVSMLCSVTDGDLPISLTWFRDDAKMLTATSSGNDGIVISQIGSYESVLRIDHLRPGHNANFTCVAENPAGSAAHSQTLRVKGTFQRDYGYGERELSGCRISLAVFSLHAERAAKLTRSDLALFPNVHHCTTAHYVA